MARNHKHREEGMSFHSLLRGYAPMSRPPFKRSITFQPYHVGNERSLQHVEAFKSWAPRKARLTHGDRLAGICHSSVETAPVYVTDALDRWTDGIKLATFLLRAFNLPGSLWLVGFVSTFV